MIRYIPNYAAPAAIAPVAGSQYGGAMLLLDPEEGEQGMPGAPGLPGATGPQGVRGMDGEDGEESETTASPSVWPVERGGTGANTPAGALTALGAVSITGTDSITGVKTFASGTLKLAGSISGTTELNATAVAGAGAVILPVTGTLATLLGVETLTNKTLTAPTLTAPALGTPTALVLSTVETGTAFPGSPYEGQRWYRTDLEDWFYWDASRSKWLGTSLICFEAYDAALLAANTYLQLPGGIVMAAAIGWQLPWAATVVAAHGYKADTGLASTFRFRRNGTNVAAMTFAAAADNHVQSATINQDCAATTAVTDALQIFMTTGGVQNAAGNYARFYLRRNAT